MSQPCRQLPRAGALLVVWLAAPLRAAPPEWDAALIKLERWPANAAAAHVSTAIPVAADLLATILIKPAESDTFRAVTASSILDLRLLARDEASGFSLLSPVSAGEKAWPAVPLLPASPVLPPGTSLLLQSATPTAARLAGRELLHQSRLLECPWLRVHLPAGTWMHGTPLTGPDGNLAGLLAGGVPGVTDAGRVLPAAAVQHFVKLWIERRTLARAMLGIRLSPATGIPRVEECIAGLPAERAGLQPGDVLLTIGATSLPDAAAATEACFYLRVDEPVAITVLRGTETMNLQVTPVSAAAGPRTRPEKP